MDLNFLYAPTRDEIRNYFMRGIIVLQNAMSEKVMKLDRIIILNAPNQILKINYLLSYGVRAKKRNKLAPWFQ